MPSAQRYAGLLAVFLLFSSSWAGPPLSGTEPLDWEGDIAARMVAGIRTYLERETSEAALRREENSPLILQDDESLVVHRDRLRTLIGAADDRVTPNMHRISPLSGQGDADELLVRWQVLEGFEAEGYLFRPTGKSRGFLVLLPDCDDSVIDGAELELVRSMTAAGVEVLVPVLIDRDCTWSGREGIRWTNQPHREFVYRAAYPMGRHPIGLEVQMIQAAVDHFYSIKNGGLPIGVAGYGEGGLLAFYAGAVDPRIDLTAVSGYFQPREDLWSEPIYRNLWGLLKQYGDAEIAALYSSQKLLIEASIHPSVTGPPQVDGRTGGAPGKLTTPPLERVQSEVTRAERIASGRGGNDFLQLIIPTDGRYFGPELTQEILSCLIPSGGGSPAPVLEPVVISPAQRKRAFDESLDYTQKLMRDSPKRRAELWAQADATSVESWVMTTQPLRKYFWDEVIGGLAAPSVPARPRTRQVFDQPEYVGYEVVLDVHTDVFAFGILLMPKGILEGEKRPVVVCQHGLEGRPSDVADPRVENPYYSQYACRLAERGFITFSPQNPYIGGDDFRVLQRMANPLKLSLFSFITRQHERIIEWLRTLPSVDPDRIGFYGLSYGGKTAMRVPALLSEGYCLSICSADYNEWIWKNVSADAPFSYLYTGEYEMPEFDLGNTFNYAEMSWLIFPRPFMVERGHHDGVAPDEWVAYEFAKTFRRYSLLGLAERAEIEFFDGPHSIHGEGTFEFLHKHLNHPAPN